MMHAFRVHRVHEYSSRWVNKQRTHFRKRASFANMVSILSARILWTKIVSAVMQQAFFSFANASRIMLSDAHIYDNLTIYDRQ